jgi:DNA-directed RNA polymerase subunit H
LANVLVPKHELLDAEGVPKLLERYGVTKAELPKIKKSDAALADIKPKTGDVIRINRTGPVVGESYYYRVVVEG